VLALTAPRLRPDRLAIDLGRQESVVGFLPIGPAGGEGAAEIAAVDKTARDAVATVVALARRLGRQPVQVAGATGIAAARLQAALPDGPHALEREGRSLLAAGVTRSANDIDVLCVHGLRLPRHEGGPMWMAAERRRSVSPELLQ
jgi:3-hydroxyacyl-CoA dehydrogenase